MRTRKLTNYVFLKKNVDLNSLPKKTRLVYDALERSGWDFNLSVFSDHLWLWMWTVHVCMKYLLKNRYIAIAKNQDKLASKPKKQVEVCSDCDTIDIDVPEAIAKPLEIIVKEFIRLYEVEAKYNKIKWMLKAN